MNRIDPAIFQLIFSSSLTAAIVGTGIWKLLQTGESVWFDKVLAVVTLWLPSPAAAIKEWIKKQQELEVNIDVDQINLKK